MANQHDKALDQRESIPVQEKPTGELANRMHDKISAKWDEVTIEPDEYLNPAEPYSPPEWSFSLRGINFSNFGDFHYLQGQKGNGKTYTYSILITCAIKGSWGELRYVGTRKDPKVLLIDTEQSKGNVNMEVRRIYHMIGWEQGSQHDQLKVLMLRETPDPVKRWAKTIRAIYDCKPDFIFLDGMLDVVHGMNKEEECNIVISETGALSSIFNACMWGIIHENPVQQKIALDGGSKPAGHQGSFAERKGAAGIASIKTLDNLIPTITVKQKKARNKDFGDWQYGIKDEPVLIDGKTYMMGIPYPIIGTKPEDDEDEALRQRVRTTMGKLNWDLEGNRYKDIESGLKSLGITSNRMISDYITIAQEIGILTKDNVKKRYFAVYDNVEDINSQTSFEEGEDNSKPPF